MTNFIDKNKPIVFLDWDDTMFPTTHWSKSGVSVPITYVSKLNEFLDYCNTKFNLIVVTNMEYDGLSYYIRKFGIRIPSYVVYTREFPYSTDKSLLFSEVVSYYDKTGCNTIITIGDCDNDHKVLDFDRLKHYKFRTYSYESFEQCMNKIDEIKIELDKL